MSRFFYFILFLFILVPVLAQPLPGDLYREFTWFNDVEDCGGALRVGGRLDYRLTENAVPYAGGGQIRPVFDVDLNRAVRAELVVEKMLCHGGTVGLRVMVNGHEPVPVPESGFIPEPRSAYAHHFNQVVPIDLAQLTEGKGNTFEFEVDTAGHWWPQNLLYGMVLRIYYEPSVLEERGKIISPVTGGKVGATIPVQLVFPHPAILRKADLVGYYEDADLEGDGNYRQWHYGYHKGQLYHHIGTISQAPFEFTWDTEWLPDQEEKMKLAAQVHLEDGLVYMTEPVEDLELRRPGYSVELCKPEDQPEGWFTRNGEFTQRFFVEGDLEHVSEAKMVFRSWSPGYFNGIYINDFLVFLKEGPRYAYFEHDIPVTDLHVFNRGENILKTGKTPLYQGEMVHGVEVQWPGIMFLIKYDLREDGGSQSSH